MHYEVTYAKIIEDCLGGNMKHILNYSFLFFVAGVGLFVPYIGLLLFVLMITIIILSFTKGRKFCGKVCPHGFLFDNLLVKLSRRVRTPKVFMSIIISGLYFGYFVITFSLNIYKSIHADNFLTTLSYAMSNMYFIVTLVSISLGLLFSPRTFCHFCPQGTMQKGVMKLSKQLGVQIKNIKIADEEKCISCRLCNKNCPMGIAVIDEMINGELLNQNCIKCEKCINSCPKKILFIG